MNKFAAFQSVKVTGPDYERTGQVGVAVGPGDDPNETAVKFEGENPGDPQVIDTFPNDDLTGL